LGLNRRFTLGRRSGRASPIERLAHSAEVIENPLDDGGLLDARHHPKLAAAAPAGFDVDHEDALEPLRPSHRPVLHLARKARAGDRIEGTGGARKVRFAGRGKGKIGGYRVISYFGGDDVPVFLLNVFAKGDKVNLSKAERNELKRILKRPVKGF